jgi:WD40 repeat protein
VAAGIPGATPFGGHAGPAFCVAFSPDGRLLATGGRDGNVRLTDLGTETQIAQFTGHTDGVKAVAWSPDGTRIASAGADGTTRLWEAVSGAEVARLTGHSNQVNAVAWSPDGTRVASGAGTVRLWDAVSGAQVGQLRGHSNQVNAVAWSPDGTRVASGAGTVRLWDAVSGAQVGQLRGHSNPVHAVAWSPDGTRLASGGNSVRLWEPAASVQVGQLESHTGPVWAVAWSPDGTRIAAASDAIDLWDVRDVARPTRATRIAEGLDRVWAVDWSPDGSRVASAGQEATVRLWDAASGAEATRFMIHSGRVHAVAWSPDGGWAATVGEDWTVRLWDAESGAEAGQLTDHAETIATVAWSPDGTCIVTGGTDGTARVWDAGSGTQAIRLTGHAGQVTAVAWSPDGFRIASADQDKTVRLWDATSGAQVARFSEHTSSVKTVAWWPGGTRVASFGENGRLLLWDTASGASTVQIADNPRWTNAIAWSPDGTRIATAGDDGSIVLWWGSEPGAGGVPQFTGHTGPVRAVAWSPEGSHIASADSSGTVLLWDASSGSELARCTGHIGAVQAVAWSPRGDRLASAGDDGTIRIWNPRSGRQINGTGFGAARAPVRPLAGVRSDSPSDVDLLGIGDDVGTLAELIAAKETRPPLALALIGDWGAGKSSVMLQVEAGVADLAAKARGNPGLSAFAENVRQVRFNAWHYSDDHLWAGLVSHIFEELARPEDPTEAGDDRSARAEIARVRGDLAAQREQLASRQSDADRLAAVLQAAGDAPRPQGVLAGIGSPSFGAWVLGSAVKQAIRDVRSALLTLVTWAVLGGGVYLTWRYLGAWLGSVASAVAVLAGPAIAVLRKLRAGHQKLLDFAAGQRATLEASQKQVQVDIRATEQGIRDLEDRVVLIDAAESLARFLDDHAGGTGYREYQGLLGQVRADLDLLSAKLARARRQWASAGGFGPPPLERIVLYIDDLDRCPPRRVVEVLEAVHLMLALDLFVVVVAVDARWLIRSLEYHHHELFRSGAELSGGAGKAPEVVTPIDYLDKIFQVPYVLTPPHPEATAVYLRSLLPAAQNVQAQRGLVRPAPPGQAPATVVGDDVATSPDLTVVSRGTDSQLPADPAPVADGREASSADGGPTAAGRRELPSGRPAGQEPPTAQDRDPRRIGMPGAGGDLARAATTDLQPQGLQVSPAEAEFLARLAGLLPTPRAAKRLVNLYRLTRIGIPTSELGEFVGDQDGGPYQSVQVLLAILVGYPELAARLFREVMSGRHGASDLIAVLEEAADSGDREAGAVADVVASLRAAAPQALSPDLARQWCPRLARFSFYTRDLALQQRTETRPG